jgi:cell division septal protein FtsQ
MRLKTVFSWTLAISVVVLLGRAGWILFTNDTLKINSIEFVLADGFEAEQTLFDKIVTDSDRATQPFRNQWIWNVHLENVLKAIEADPRIRNVHLLRRFPNHIVAVIQPHETAANLLDKNGLLHPVAKDGTLLPPTAPGEAADRPTLRGARFFTDHQVRLRAIQLLADLPDHGLLSKAAISEVHFKEKKGFEFTLVGSGVVINIGDESLAQKADHIEQVLAYLQSQHIKGRVIDARFDKKVVVKLRKQP